MLPGFFILTFENFQKFLPVCGDEFFFQIGSFKLHRNIIVICRNQSVSSLEMSDVHNLCFRKVQDIFHSLRLLVFHIEDNLGFTVVDDTFSVFSIIQCKKVV